MTATAEAPREGRFINVLFGARLVVAPWLLGGAFAVAKWNGVLALPSWASSVFVVAR